MSGSEWVDRTIYNLYEGLLHRPPDPAGLIHYRDVLSAGGTGAIPGLIQQFIDSAEYTQSVANVFSSGSNVIDDYRFRIPQQFVRDSGRSRRILLVGSCLMDNWGLTLRNFDSKLSIDRIVFNYGSPLPIRHDLASFDFQIVQIPLRAILPEGMFFHLRYDDQAGWEGAFEESKKRLLQNVDAGIAYNRASGLRSFVLGFQVPQQNPAGRLQNRYALNNLCYYVEQLNRFMYEAITTLTDVYYIDFDQIISTYGKKYYQDDAIAHSSHGSQLGPATQQSDNDRIEPVGDVRDVYAPAHHKVILATYQEALAGERSVLQTDSVKLVIFDLDDTLWRGVAAEQDDVDPYENIEGWPLGVIEAVSNLWRRGILLAIVSKNDEGLARQCWDKLYGKIFSMDNFASVKISWGSKADAIRDILREMNLLPASAVFVDDNPVERARVSEAFPEIRMLGGSILEWRRVLLWSAETQRSAITQESADRTEMVKARAVREAAFTSMDQSNFHETLELEVIAAEISSVSDNSFERAYELVNKTNQFNTTGRRWSKSEFDSYFRVGGTVITGTVSDRFTNYGMVVLVMVCDGIIDQFVMSCRVFGLGVEQAMLKEIADRYPTRPLQVRLTETEKNSLALAFFANAAGTEGGPRLELNTKGMTPLLEFPRV